MRYIKNLLKRLKTRVRAKVAMMFFTPVRAYTLSKVMVRAEDVVTTASVGTMSYVYAGKMLYSTSITMHYASGKCEHFYYDDDHALGISEFNFIQSLVLGRTL